MAKKKRTNNKKAKKNTHTEPEHRTKNPTRKKKNQREQCTGARFVNVANEKRRQWMIHSHTLLLSLHCSQRICTNTCAVCVLLHRTGSGRLGLMIYEARRKRFE